MGGTVPRSLGSMRGTVPRSLGSVGGRLPRRWGQWEEECPIVGVSGRKSTPPLRSEGGR
ncbi:unnamed protein product, partial [Staurois parvus]